jgi:heme-degrading monooxygenase HmoA
MTLVVATRMKVNRPRDVPAFFRTALAVARQSKGSPGFRGGSLRVEPTRTFWTLTAWEDAASMSAFRDTGAHREAMPALAAWADEAYFVAWSQPDGRMPGWSDLRQRLPGRPLFADLDHPSDGHRRRDTPGPGRVGLVRRLRDPAGGHHDGRSVTAPG